MQADLGSRLASCRSGCDWKSESDRRDGCRFGNAVKGRCTSTHMGVGDGRDTHLIVQ